MNTSTTVRRPALLALSLLAAGALAGCATPAGQQSAGEGVAEADSPTSTAADSAAPTTAVAGAGSTSSTSPEAATSSQTATSNEPLATDTGRPSSTQVVLSWVTWDQDSDALIAGGYVSPVIEDDGTCTLVLTRGGTSVRATVYGKVDATSTDCGDLSVPRTQLTAGTWSAVLTYSSDDATGKSVAVSVEVPA